MKVFNTKLCHGKEVICSQLVDNRLSANVFLPSSQLPYFVCYLYAEGNLFNTHELITPEMLDFKGKFYYFYLVHNKCYTQTLLRTSLIESKATHFFSSLSRL